VTKVHGEQIVEGSISADALDLTSLTDALTATPVGTQQSNFAASIARIQARYAFDQSWTVTRTLTVNVNQPWIETARSSTVYTVSVIINKIAQTLSKEVDQINSTVKTATTVIMFPGDYTPDMSDNITWNNESYNISSIDVYKPSNVVLFYVIGLMK
jgi:hypothetical protein